MLVLSISLPALACCNPKFFAQANQKSLQELIDEAPAGSVIYIPSGVYVEHLVVNKSITIVGENPTNTVISGGNVGELIRVSADNVSIYNLTLSEAEQAIGFYKVRNCEVIGNTIRNILKYPGTGIYAYNCENIVIGGNRFESVHVDNIIFEQTRNSVVKENTFIANKRLSQPILLYNSSGNLIESNLVLGLEDVENEGGIGILYSNDNVIQYNTVLYNDWAGISLRYSNSCIIRGNTIAGHRWYGMKMSYCRNNVIYWNNFLLNYRHVYVQGCENLSWSLGKFGNFWDNYVGEDHNMDGIGDRPNQIDNENFDSYPLMGKFYYFKIIDSNIVENEIFLFSNSTVEGLFTLKTNEQASIILSVTGHEDTSGFCLVMFSNDIMEPPYNVKLNESSPIVLLDYSNSTHALLYIAYHHKIGGDSIIIIPEIKLETFVLVIICASIILRFTRPFQSTK